MTRNLAAGWSRPAPKHPPSSSSLPYPTTPLCYQNGLVYISTVLTCVVNTNEFRVLLCLLQNKIRRAMVSRLGCCNNLLNTTVTLLKFINNETFWIIKIANIKFYDTFCFIWDKNLVTISGLFFLMSSH